MPDEIEIYTSLESPLYGGLLHVLETLCRTVEADAAAARVFDCPALSPDCCTLNGRLHLEPAQEAVLANWPLEQGCLFELLATRRPPAGVSRPRELFDERTFASPDVFRQIDSFRPVTDCLCQCLELHGKSWAVLSYLRTAPHLPFVEDQIALLRRLQPTVQRIVRGSLRRQLTPSTATGDISEHSGVFSLPRRLARLSKTERQILGYLRTAMTEKQIADELDRSHHTVHVHVKNIYRKFSISSRRQLMEMFQER